MGAAEREVWGEGVCIPLVTAAAQAANGMCWGVRERVLGERLVGAGVTAPDGVVWVTPLVTSSV